ncbi:MAG: glycosyltransferase family 4 protein [Patescibacteria group bacterium]
MKKVLFYIPTFPTFSQNFIAREIEALTETKDFDIYILSLMPGKRGTIPDSLRRKVLYFSTSKPRRIMDCLLFFLKNPIKFLTVLLKYEDRVLSFGTAVSMLSVIKSLKPDIIFANWITEGALIANMLRDLTSIPFAVECHAEDIWLTKPSILRARILDAKFVLTCTDYNALYLKKICARHCEGRIHVVRHYATNKLFGRVYKKRGPVPQIYLVGRMIEKKGFIYFLKAAKILKDRGVLFKAVIAGDPGTEKEKLVSECMRLSLNDILVFSDEVDFTEHSHNYLESDIFVAPSVISETGDIDGIPNVIVEAMLAGLPVVASRISAIPEVVEDGITGFLVSEKDERMLADRIEILLTDKQLRENMGLAGKEKVENLFSYENTILRIKEFLLMD